MPDLTSPDETLQDLRQNRLRRLIYRSSYTGMKETDQLLRAFARDELTKFNDDELGHYEDLLDAGDQAVWSWVSQQEMPPSDRHNPVLDKLIAWCRRRHDGAS
jgi:succinate dehydrogenase flavin-adding protein (antitoxin of CptAB toxin-antitoxin module)